MAHFAQLDNDNKVINVVVTDNNDPNGDEGYQWLLDNIGGTWIKTSYNSNIRGKFAGIGDTYDEINDEFYTPEAEPQVVTSTQIEQTAIEATEATKEVK